MSRRQRNPNISIERARGLIKRYGNDRSRLDQEVRHGGVTADQIPWRDHERSSYGQLQLR
jgi:hypothetical protein